MPLEKLGPYNIVRKLGEGGMGAVYEGIHEETLERAAVKLLPPALAAKGGFLDRFRVEIETLRKVEHPNIVRIYGWGEAEDTLFYAMEVVDGASLETELDCGRKFNWKELVEIGVQTCRALKHAHDRGIIHRDIKPANIMLTLDGQVKLSDFGIAKLYWTGGSMLEGGPIGTANYMSPEQAAGERASERSDLYSMGCLFYALLTGRPPFTARTLQEMLRAQRHAKHEPVTNHAPGTPKELEVIIDRLLRKDPKDRVPNAGVLQRSLMMVVRSQALLAGEPAPEENAPDTGDSVHGTVMQLTLSPAVLKQYGDQRSPGTGVQPTSQRAGSPVGSSASGGGGSTNDATIASHTAAGGPTARIKPSPTSSPSSSAPSPVTSVDQTAATIAGTHSGAAAPPRNLGSTDLPTLAGTHAPTAPQKTVPQKPAPAAPKSGPSGPASPAVSPIQPPPRPLSPPIDQNAATIISGNTHTPTAAPVPQPYDTAEPEQPGATGPIRNSAIAPAGGGKTFDPLTPTLADDMTLASEAPAAPASAPGAQRPPQIKPASPRAGAASPDSATLAETGTGAADGRSARRFTTADEARRSEQEEAKRQELEQARAARRHIVLAIVGVIAVVGLILGSLTLLSAYKRTNYQMYDRIKTQIESNSPDALLDARTDIQDFIRFYPNDPRTEEMKRHLEEIELQTKERQARIRSRRMGDTETRSPVERAYMEALNYAQVDPEKGVSKMRALIDLFAASANTSESDRQYLELARRRSIALQQQINQYIGGMMIMLRQRLDRAEEVAADDPVAARRICQSVIELYGEKPWAARLAARARALLATLPAAPIPDGMSEPTTVPALGMPTTVPSN